MPAKQTFYEAQELFPPFEQMVTPGLSTSEVMAQLNEVGHYGLGHLNINNPDSPRLLPRYTLTTEYLKQARSLVELESKGFLLSRLHLNTQSVTAKAQSYCIHTKASSSYPDSLLYLATNGLDKKLFSDQLAVMSKLELARYATLELPNLSGMLLQRPDLDPRGSRKTFFRLQSLAAPSTHRATSLNRDNQNLLAIRLACFYGTKPHQIKRLKAALEKFEWSESLRHFWLCESELRFPP